MGDLAARRLRTAMVLGALAVPLLLVVWLVPPPGEVNRPHPIPPNPQHHLPGEKARGGSPVGSVSLVENARFWDGRTVTFRGEAVGDLMVRGEQAWLHLNDDAYMWRNIEEGAMLGGYNSGLGIWLPAALAREVRHLGDYGHEGDVLEVRGRFNAVCRLHGGDMDIHADLMTTVKVGHPVHNPPNRRRAALAGLLLATAGILFLVRGRMLRRRV